MNKSATSSLLGASATRLTRFANHAQTRTMRAQQSVTMIDTMGLRVKAQTPAAQRMARKSFPLAPSCRRGRRQPSKGSGQSRMPHIAARPAPLQRPATSPDAPLRKGSKWPFREHSRWSYRLLFGVTEAAPLSRSCARTAPRPTLSLALTGKRPSSRAHHSRSGAEAHDMHRASSGQR